MNHRSHDGKASRHTPRWRWKTRVALESDDEPPSDGPNHRPPRKRGVQRGRESLFLFPRPAAISEGVLQAQGGRGGGGKPGRRMPRRAWTQ